MKISTANHVRPQFQLTTTPAKVTGIKSKTSKTETGPDVITISVDAILRQQQDTKRNAFLANFSPQEAGDFAKSFANDPFQYGPIGGVLDISGLQPGGDGIIRYSNGSPVTMESEAYFERQNKLFFTEKNQIYTSETAKGTPPKKILEKLLIAMDNQPDLYRMMMDWDL